MTEQEIIAEVRKIAAVMSVSRAHAGRVSDGLKLRVRKLFLKAGLPFEPWRDQVRYEPDSDPPQGMQLGGKVILLGYRVNEEAGELCAAIAERLLMVRWETLSDPKSTSPEFHGWTAKDGENAILKAASELPKLCDRLEALGPNAFKAYPSPKTFAKDQYIWAHITKLSCKELKLEIEKRIKTDGWKPITTTQGFGKASKRYSKHYKLPTRNFMGETPYEPTETD